MKGQIVSSLLVAVTLFGSTEGQLRANPDDTCWYPSHMCEMDAPISERKLSELTLALQAEACYNDCAAEALCNFFTVNQFRGEGTCYLLTVCTENLDNTCLDKPTCKSGPKDCGTVTDNAPCAKIDSANTPPGTIHWQCTDSGSNPVNGYTATDIKPQTTCILSCESWEDQAGYTGQLESTCQNDGTWTVTKASDGEDELAFPLKDNGAAYPTPADLSSLECGCKNLDVKWPVNAAEGETTWWYDPNFEAGADFVCDTPITTDDGEYIIETGNTCTLFCDSHLVATVRCLNGDWTGSPDLGFWCYSEPEVINGLTPAPAPED